MSFTLLGGRDSSTRCRWIDGPSRGTQGAHNVLAILLFITRVFFLWFLYSLILCFAESRSWDGRSFRPILGKIEVICSRRSALHLHSWWSGRQQLHREPVRFHILDCFYFDDLFFLISDIINETCCATLGFSFKLWKISN